MEQKFQWWLPSVNLTEYSTSHDYDVIQNISKGKTYTNYFKDFALISEYVRVHQYEMSSIKIIFQNWAMETGEVTTALWISTKKLSL